MKHVKNVSRRPVKALELGSMPGKDMIPTSVEDVKGLLKKS